MNSKQKRTWKAIFENPVRADVKWTDIENLFVALGAKVSEGNGSRVRIFIKERVATFHRPHPGDETGKATLKDVRDLLSNANIEAPKVE